MIKKLIMKAMMFAFIMFGLSTYAGYLITGRLPPYLNKLIDFIPAMPSKTQPTWTDIGSLEHKSVAKKDNYEVMQSGKTVIYKWKNPNGTWNYSSDAPPANAHAIRQEISLPTTVEQVDVRVDENQSESKAADVPLVNPYTPEGVKKLIDDAKQVRSQADERNREQQKHLNEL